jgi:dynein heavy chain 1
VAGEFTKRLDLSRQDGGGGDDDDDVDDEGDDDDDGGGGGVDYAERQRGAVVSTLVYVHNSVAAAADKVALAHGNNNARTHITPRHYLDCLHQFTSLFAEKRAALEEQQRHLHAGLRKLTDTQTQV